MAGELGGITVIVVDDAIHPHEAFWDLIADGAPTLPPVPTTPDTPGLLIYTSGTTGAPKGALHGHRVLLGHLPGFELSHNFFPQDDDRFWTPADWAWIGGLMDALMPSWFHGRPVVAAGRGRFDPEWALRLMTDARIRNVFFPPTVLKLMRQAQPEPAKVVAALDDVRRRAARRGDPELGAGHARRDDQRDLRPDRGQLRGRQLPRGLGRPPGLDGPSVPRPRRRGHRCRRAAAAGG